MRRDPYARICEAVARGDERQGRDLVQAILDYIDVSRIDFERKQKIKRLSTLEKKKESPF